MALTRVTLSGISLDVQIRHTSKYNLCYMCKTVDETVEKHFKS
jgi:hypothetical protein